MKRLNKAERELVNDVLEDFKKKCNRAIKTYEEAGVDESNPMAGRPLLYYKHAKKYLDFMIWFLDPNKKQAGRRMVNG